MDSLSRDRNRGVWWMLSRYSSSEHGKQIVRFREEGVESLMRCLLDGVELEFTDSTFNHSPGTSQLKNLSPQNPL